LNEAGIDAVETIGEAALEWLRRFLPFARSVQTPSTPGLMRSPPRSPGIQCRCGVRRYVAEQRDERH